MGFWGFGVLDDFFRFSKNSGFWVFLVHPTVVSVLLSASVERCFVSRMRDFSEDILLRYSVVKKNPSFGASLKGEFLFPNFWDVCNILGFPYMGQTSLHLRK